MKEQLLSIRTQLLIAVLTFTIHAAQSQATVLTDSLPPDKNVIYGKLSNGFSYCILKNDSPAGKISMQLTVKVGYPDESSDELGVSHLIEHLGFRSTRNFKNGLRKGLNRLGFSLGYDFNAQTGNNTSYYATIPSKDTAIFSTFLKAFSDFACGQTFKEAEVSEEKAAVVNEISIGNTGGLAALFGLQYKLLGLERDFQQEVINDQTDNVQKVTIKDIRNFYYKWYTPDNQILVVVGDVDVLKAEHQVKKIFNEVINSSLRTSNSHGPRSLYANLNGKEHRYIVVENPSSHSIEVTLYRMRSSGGDIRYPATTGELKTKVLDDLFNCLVKNRLEQVKMETGLSSGDFSNIMQRGAINESYGIDAMQTNFHVSSVTDMKVSIQFIETELQRITRWGFTEKEMQKARRQIASRFSQGSRSSSSLASELVAYQNKGVPLPRDPRNEYKEILDKMANQEIIGAFGKWLIDDTNLDIAISGPANLVQTLPPKEKIIGWINESNAVALSPFVENDIPKLPYIPRNLAPGKYSLKPLDDQNALELRLANGARVILKSLGTTYKTVTSTDPGIAYSVFKTGGAADYRNGDYQSALASAEIQSNAGIGNLSLSEYRRWQSVKTEAGSTIGIAPYIADNEAGLRGGATLNNYEDLLNLIYLHFIQPRKDSIAFAEWFGKKESKLSRKKRPALLLEDSIARTIGANSIFDSKAALSLKALKEIDYNRSFEIYKEIFSNPGDYTFIFTGFFDPKELVEVTNRYIGAIPNDTRSKRHKPEQKAADMVTSKWIDNLRVTLAGDAIGNVSVRLLLRCVSESEPLNEVKLKVLNEMVNSAMFNRLREREKGVYSVASILRISGEPNVATLDIKFDAQSDKVELLVNAAIDEVEQIAANNFGKEEFNKAVSIVREGLTRQVNDPYYWAWTVKLRDQYGLPNPSDGNSDLKLLNTLTPSELATFTREHAQVKKYALFTLENIVSEDDLTTMRNDLVEKYGSHKADSMVMALQIQYYFREKDYQKHLKTYIEYVQRYDLIRTGSGKNSAAWHVFDYATDSADIGLALQWIRKAQDEDPNNAYFLDTFSNLLYKSGRLNEALALQSTAIWMGRFGKVFVENYFKMKAGVPTWKYPVPVQSERDVKSDPVIWGSIQKQFIRMSDSLVWQARLSESKSHARKGDFANVIVQYVEQFKPVRNASSLNEHAWMVFQFSDDRTELKKALKWSDASIEDPNASTERYAFIDTYANLLFKLGRSKKAIEWEEKALSLCPLDEKPNYETTLAKMKKGEKTWP